MTKKQSQTPNAVLERSRGGEVEGIIKKTENYVKKCMQDLAPNVHDFKHVDRVGKWALKIAKAENKDLFLTKMAVLLHDIGRSKEKPPKILHADIGSKMAYSFLIKNKLVSKKEAKQIAYAVAHHAKGGKGWLVDIVQDADKLDGLGAIGLTRIIQDAPDVPEYIEDDLLNKNKICANQIKISEILKKRKHIGDTIMQKVDFHISWYKNIHTKTAKKLAQPLLQYLKNFKKQFKKELKQFY